MEQSIQARFSRKITVLSFVATVMIVGMHTGSMLAYSSNAGVLFFRQFFTQYLFDVAVPFFFVVSGYWFAQGYCRAGAKYNSYSGFIGKKVKTLLVPYLVFSLWGFNDGWCLVYFPFAVVFYAVVGLVRCYLLKRYLPSVHSLIGGGRG